MKVAGLFAGIGGIEYGLSQSGFQTELFCEIMDSAKQILQKNYPDVPVHSDIRTLKSLPKVDLVSAGFPCQDLSIAGRKIGLSGTNSSLISEVFRLLKIAGKDSPDFLLIENVPYLLNLNKGEAIKYITETVSALGYDWAYRIIDPRAFGLPQRRPRLIFLASKIVHPKELLFLDNENEESAFDDRLVIQSASNYGFYWTEGRIGIGWAKDSIPPIKSGSGLGIPSPPAIWLKEKNYFGTPIVEDAERLQGFPENWTLDPTESFKKSLRWKLIGNAVNTAVSAWLGKKIIGQLTSGPRQEQIFAAASSKWPKAAFGQHNTVWGVRASTFPKETSLIPIDKFVRYPLCPLSYRAVSGFYKRVVESTLIKYPGEFIVSLESFIANNAIK